MARRRTTSGFTLVELLVVIAIITLLVSILLPSLNRAKELAKSVVCLSNAKAQATGLLMYAAPGGDLRLPYLQNFNGVDGRLDSYWNGHTWADLLSDGQLTAIGVYECPTTPDAATVKADRLPMHYGLNFYLYGVHISNWGGTESSYRGSRGTDYTNDGELYGPSIEQDIRQPAASIMLCDASPSVGSVGLWNWRAQGFLRHAMHKTTYAYFDGHAAHLTFKEVFGTTYDDSLSIDDNFKIATGSATFNGQHVSKIADLLDGWGCWE